MREARAARATRVRGETWSSPCDDSRLVARHLRIDLARPRLDAAPEVLAPGEARPSQESEPARATDAVRAEQHHRTTSVQLAGTRRQGAERDQARALDPRDRPFVRLAHVDELKIGLLLAQRLQLARADLVRA